MNFSLLNKLLDKKKKPAKGLPNPDALFAASYITSNHIENYFLNEPIALFESMKKFEDEMNDGLKIQETDVLTMVMESL
jgi:hypothetical protein